MHWLLSLVSGNKVIEDPVLDKEVMESLCDYHIAEDDRDQDQYSHYLPEKDFVGGRGSFPVLSTLDKILIHHDHDFPLEVIFFSKIFMFDETRSWEERVKQKLVSKWTTIWAKNKHVQTAKSPVLKVITQATLVDGGSIYSTSSVASKEKEASDKLAVFMALLFASLILDIHREVVNYNSAELTYNLKEVFEFISPTTD